MEVYLTVFIGHFNKHFTALCHSTVCVETKVDFLLYLFCPDRGLFTLAEHWSQTASYVLIYHMWIF